MFVSPLFFQVFDDVEVIIAVITLEFQRIGVVDEGGGSPFGVIIEAIVRSAEVLLRGGSGIHEAHVLAGFGQRIERNVRSFARTGQSAVARDEFRNVVDFENNRFVSRHTARTKAQVVVPAVIVTDLIFMQAQDILNVLDSELLVRREGVRELFSIGDLFTGDVFPSHLVTTEVVAGGTLFSRLNSDAEVKVVVDAWGGGFVTTVLDGAFDQARGNDHVFGVGGVNLIHHEVIRDINHFIVFDTAGNPNITLVDGELPGFTSAVSAFCHQAANTVTHATVFQFLVFVKNV